MALAYRVEIAPLSPADGGGYLATVPDLPGCMSDGETPAAALASVEGAVADWLADARQRGATVPEPIYAAA